MKLFYFNYKLGGIVSRFLIVDLERELHGFRMLLRSEFSMS